MSTRSRAAMSAALAGVMVLATATACSESSSTGSAPTLEQIRPVLARHAQALLDRSREEFLADVDTGQTASEFRTEQGQEFDNLTDVPLQSWSYDVESVVTDTAALSAANQRAGAPVSIVHLVLRYRLRGIDAEPSSHDMWWTFVTRDGKPRINGEDDLSDSGGSSWRGPWDFGPLIVRSGAACLVFVHPAQAAAIDVLVSAVDAAVGAVTRVVGSNWAQRVAVVVPSNDAELAEQVQGAAAVSLGDISSETVFDAYGSTGAPTGARVIVNPDVLGKLTDVGRRIVLQHEITHVAMAADTGLSTPRWLAEGFADYVGNTGSGQPVTVAAAELRADVRKGDLPDSLPSDAAMDAGTAGAAAAYEQAWLACRYIASLAGTASLIRFYRTVGHSTETVEAAVADALATVVGIRPAGQAVEKFTAAWVNYVKAELG